MLKEVGEAIKAVLETKFKQVEYYEGQFERFDEQVINPPAVYIDYVSGEGTKTEDPFGTMNFILFVMTSKLERNPGNMLEMIETVIGLFQDKGLRDEKGVYLGRGYYDGYRNNTTFPGLIIYEVALKVVR